MWNIPKAPIFTTLEFIKLTEELAMDVTESVFIPINIIINCLR